MFNYQLCVLLSKVAFGVLFVVVISCAGTSPQSGNPSASGGGDSVQDPGNPTNPSGGGGGGGGGLVSTLDFSLATSDYIVGTTGDDVFSGNVSTTMQSTDRVNGADGNDVIVVSGATLSSDLASLPTTVSNVEIINFSSSLTAGAWDLSSIYSTSNGINVYDFSDIAALSSNTITTGNVGTLKIATGAGGLATAGGVTWAMDNTVTAPALQLVGYQGNASVPSNLTIAGTGATSLAVSSSVTPSKIATLDVPAGVLVYTLSGDAAMTFALAALDVPNPNSMNASTMTTGGAVVDLSGGATKAGFTFTGSPQNDNLILSAGNLAALTAGSQINLGTGALDKLSTFDTSIGSFPKLNAVVGTEVLGLKAAISIDTSLVTVLSRYAIDTAGIAVTLTNLTNGNSVDVGFGAASTFTTGTLTLSGTATTPTLRLGSTDDTVSYTTTLAGTGLTGVNIESNGAGTNTITSAPGYTYTVTGLTPITFGGLAAAGSITSSGPVLNATGSSAADSLTGFTGADTLLGAGGVDTINGGLGVDTIQGGLASVLNQADVLTGGGGADTFKFVATNTSVIATDVGTILGESSGTTAIVRITDFVAGTDKLGLEVTGAPVSGTSMVLDTPQTIATCADLTDIYAQVVAIVPSVPGGALSGVVITCSAGAAAGTYVYINNATAGVATADMLINMTGLSGTLTAADFTLN
ncbi:MAG: bluetail domain-containing putative surface protein [Myxococcota bacterium]